MEWEGVDRIHLAHDRYQWRAVVNTLMNLRLPGKQVKPGNLPKVILLFWKWRSIHFLKMVVRGLQKPQQLQ
jgi:hypothetical protein